MSEQPEALRLANEIIDFSRRGFETEDQARLRRYKAAHAASAELRRLHALCEESRDVVRGLLNALPSATTHPAIRAARVLMENLETEQ